MRVRYRTFQMQWARLYLLPWLGHIPARVLDLGCGDGGVAAELRRQGATTVGRDLFRFKWPPGDWELADARRPQSGQFDLIVLRDVLEHVGAKGEVLVRAKDALATHGRIFVSFPPYRSPYGGHQQSELNTWYRFLPWLHWHPRLRHIRKTGLTMRRFERLAQDCGLRVIKQRRYIIRPFVALRYGLKAVRGNGGEWLTGGVWYLLAKESARR